MSNELALVKKDIVDVVQNRVNSLTKANELCLPADYSPDNALKSAFLILQDVQTKDKKPVLTACSQNSIANSLFNMIVQGLNPEKKQGYFIAYGSSLSWQRSYFGNMAIVYRINQNIGEIVAEVVYEKDNLTYNINNGKRSLTGHEQALENIDGGKIKAAYCIILSTSGEVLSTELMTIAQIHQSWKQSRSFPFDNSGKLKPESVHAKFPEEMSKRTVINKACKSIINSSNDSSVLKQSVTETDVDAADVIRELDYQENANQELLDIKADDVSEQSIIEETGEIVDGPQEENMTSEKADKILADKENGGSSQPPFAIP